MCIGFDSCSNISSSWNSLIDQSSMTSVTVAVVGFIYKAYYRYCHGSHTTLVNQTIPATTNVAA